MFNTMSADKKSSYDYYPLPINNQFNEYGIYIIISRIKLAYNKGELTAAEAACSKLDSEKKFAYTKTQNGVRLCLSDKDLIKLMHKYANNHPVQNKILRYDYSSIRMIKNDGTYVVPSEYE